MLTGGEVPRAYLSVVTRENSSEAEEGTTHLKLSDRILQVIAAGWMVDLDSREGMLTGKIGKCCFLSRLF